MMPVITAACWRRSSELWFRSRRGPCRRRVRLLSRQAGDDHRRFGGPGGGYDAYARLVQRHFGSHIPGNPSVVVQNMPGAGSLNMVNHVANLAARDGTIVGAPQTGVAFEPVFKLLSPDGKTARFDATEFGWLGNASKDIIVPFVCEDVPVRTFDDLLTTPVKMGANETNTDNSIMAVLLIRMFKAKISLFNGYPGSSSNLMLAVQSRELDGLAGMPYSSLTSRSGDWCATASCGSWRKWG